MTWRRFRGSAWSVAWSRRCSRPVRSGSSAASWSAAPIVFLTSGPLLHDVEASDPRRARGRRQERREHQHGRRLAGAVRARGSRRSRPGSTERSIPSTARGPLRNSRTSFTVSIALIRPSLGIGAPLPRARMPRPVWRASAIRGCSSRDAIATISRVDGRPQRPDQARKTRLQLAMEVQCGREPCRGLGDRTANNHGPSRARTDGLLAASQALSQLSYGPSKLRAV